MNNVSDKKKTKMVRNKSSQTGKKPPKKSDIDRYRARILQKRRRMIKSIAILFLVAVGIVIVVLQVVQKKVYHKYEVLSSMEDEDTLANNYAQLEGNLLKFGNDGASLIGDKKNILWNQTYEMQNPEIDICKGTAAIIDKNGTSMYLFNKKGPTGAVETTLPILKARVAKQGVIAAILEDGEKTWINFYDADGSLIAENQTRIDSPGYPVDLAVSPDGMLIMVTYLYIDSGTPTSYVAYYNFGEEGQEEIDNIVSGYTYAGILVPQVAYLDDDRSLAFREDGFSIYKGTKVPKEAVNVKIDKEIISTFHDSKHIGFVFKSEKKDKQYTLEVYSLSGKKTFSKDFNIEYQEIKISDSMIIMNNDSQVCLISFDGVEKFNGAIDQGNIKSIFKSGMNRYMLVTDNNIHTIKFE